MSETERDRQKWEEEQAAIDEAQRLERKRERERQSRRSTWICSGTFACLLATGVFGYYAFNCIFFTRGELGRSTFACWGGTYDRFTNRSFEGALAPAFQLWGSCHIVLKNCRIKAAEVADVYGSARLTLIGGRFEGTLSARDQGVIEVEGAEIVGKVSVSDSGKITGLPPDHAALASAKADREADHDNELARPFCAELYRCYDATGEHGLISGRVKAVVRQGEVISARAEGKDLSLAVRDCLVAKIKARRLGDGAPELAEVTCEWAGTYMPGILKLSSTRAVRRLAAVQAPSSAPASESFNEGLRLLNSGDRAGAEAAFSAACTRDNHATACGNYAGLLLDRKEYVAAERVARRGCPNQGEVEPNACNSLSIALWRQHRTAEAKAAGKRSCEGENPNGCATWGYMALLDYDAEAARDAVKSGLRMNSARVALFRLQGYVELFLSANVKGAISHFGAALRLAAEKQAKAPAPARQRGLAEIREELTELRAVYAARAPLVDQCLRELTSASAAAGP